MDIKSIDDLNIGNKDVDAVRHIFLELINELDLAINNDESKDVLISLIFELIRFGRRYFSNEENLMLKTGYDAHKSHAGSHSFFLEGIKRKLFDYMHDSANAKDIHDYICNSFFLHQIHYDKKFSAYLASYKADSD